jgi:hypothetical protein
VRPEGFLRPPLRNREADAVSLTASSTSTSPMLISDAASQLMRLGTRMGDSGTATWVRTVAATTGSSGSQKR